MPTISAIVCTRGRPAILADCLASLQRQTEPPIEILVVEANDAPASSLLPSICGEGVRALGVRVLRTRPGLPHQRNVGIDHAVGEILSFFDDDTVLEPGYLAAVADEFARDRDHRIGGVGGALVPDPTPQWSPLRRAFLKLFLLPHHGTGRLQRSGHPEYLLSPAERQEVQFLSGCNMSFRREVFASARFDERLDGYAHGEDLHFSHLVSRCWRLVVTPRARIDHREAGGGRPVGGTRVEMATRNHRLFFREQVIRNLRDWVPHGIAAVGELLVLLRHPGEGRLGGWLRGWLTSLPEAAAGRVAETQIISMLTVVVPARNEASALPACLDSLLDQTWPAERTEILVVDNLSTDATAALAMVYAARHTRVRVLRSTGPNQAAALNQAVREARGEIIVRVDAHGWVEPDYLTEVAAAFARHPTAGAIGGCYLPACAGPTSQAIAAARSSRLGVGGGWYSDPGGQEKIVRTVGCPAYRRDAILAAGLFDPTMQYAEDDELNWRVALGGRPIVLAPALRQHNRCRSSLHDLSGQYLHYGQGRARMLRHHPGFLRPRHLIPSLWVISVFVVGATAVSWPAARFPALLLTAAYLGLLTVAATEARSAGWSVAARVAPAIATIHASYGAGMLAGFLWRRRPPEEELLGREQPQAAVSGTAQALEQGESAS